MKKILCLTILLLLTVNNLVLANRLQYEELQQIDVTGDKLKETIKLIGTFNNDTSLQLQDVFLEIQLGSTRERISLKLEEGMKPKLAFPDLNHDGIKDIFVTTQNYRTDGTINSFAYIYANKKFEQLPEIKGLNVTSSFLNNYKAEILVNDQKYVMDLASRKKEYEKLGLYINGKLNEPMELMVGEFSELKPVYTLKGKAIKGVQIISGAYEEDILGKLTSTWVLEKNEWVLQNVSWKSKEEKK